MISNFHKKILHYMMNYRGEPLIRLTTSVFSYYTYDPVGSLSNLIRRRLKLSRVKTIDEGYKVMLRYILNKDFREKLYSEFVSILSNMELIREIKALSIDGGAPVILDALRKLKKIVGPDEKLKYVTEEVERIIGKGVREYKETKIKSIKTVFAVLTANMDYIKRILSQYGSLLASRGEFFEIWNLSLEEFVVSKIEFLIYLIGLDESINPLLESILPRSKGALIAIEEKFNQLYEGIDEFLFEIEKYVEQMSCLGFLIDDVEKIDVGLDAVRKFNHPYMFVSTEILDIFHNCMRIIVEELKKIT